MPVIVDHYGMVEAARGVNKPNFQALLRLVGEGAVHVKVSAPYRISTQAPIMPTRARCTRRWSPPIRSG
jgi:2-pyrone-4,6-dicarboxylate lactonase